MNKKQQTAPTKIADITRNWHVVDLQGKTLGRIASEIATLLMGKAKPNFVRNLDCGDYVVAINAKEIKASGNKELKKEYYRYSGYPGGLRTDTLGELRAKNPTYIITHAVKGMLPQNKLRDRMLKRLLVFPEATHPYEEKVKAK